ncbi:MAG: alpha/beta hydrolase family protein, partial [Noviherbaspirillum sp.]
HQDLGFDPDLLEEEAVSRHLTHPGLLIHDKDDKEVPFDESLRLHGKWHNSELVPVEGLGHRRIIQDKEVILRVLAFLQEKLRPQTSGVQVRRAATSLA